MSCKQDIIFGTNWYFNGIFFFIVFVESFVTILYCNANKNFNYGKCF